MYNNIFKNTTLTYWDLTGPSSGSTLIAVDNNILISCICRIDWNCL